LSVADDDLRWGRWGGFVYREQLLFEPAHWRTSEILSPSDNSAASVPSFVSVKICRRDNLSKHALAVPLARFQGFDVLYLLDALLGLLYIPLFLQRKEE